MIEAHEKAEAERLQKQEELSNHSRMLEKVEELEDEHEETKTAAKRGFSRDSRHERGHQSEGMAKRSSKRVGSVNRQLSDTENMAVVPYLNQKPKNHIQRKAFENLEKIRQNRELVLKKKNLDEEKQKQIEEKKKNKLKKQIELRRVELGVQKKKGEENQKAIVFKEGEIEKTAGFGDFASKNLLSGPLNDNSSNKLAKLGGAGRKFIESYKGPEVVLIDYDAEEQRDVDAIKIVVKKYTKLFKYLFTKYANSGYSVKAFNNFEELNKKLQTISVAEIMKMLRDHYVTNRIITKTKVSEIVRQVHSNSSPLPLEYRYFVEFFIQLGYIIYTSPPNNMIHLTPADTLMKLINFFEESARSRGQSTLLYEDPDATSLGDKKVIEELNKRIIINPNYPLPEGYTKVVEKDFTYEYIIPEYYEIPESIRISSYIIDSLCSKLFDFHFIEPMVKYEHKVKVKPTFKKQLQSDREPFQYMSKPERKNKLNPIVKTNSRKSSTADTEPPAVELSASLKIEVGRYPFAMRASATKVAEVLEEVLQAVSSGRSSLLPQRRAVAPLNKAEKSKLEDASKASQISQQREEKRRKRDRELKEQLKRIKQEKDRKEAEDAERIKEQEKAEAEAKRMEEKKQKDAKERKKRQMEEIKKQRQEQAERAQKEQEEEQRKAKEEQTKKNKEFLKEQKDRLKEKFESDAKERKDIETREKELRLLEKAKQKKIKQEMEGYLEKNKDNRMLELKERQEIQKFYESQEVTDLMQLYDTQIAQMYKYFTLQGNISLAGNVEKRMNVIEFNNWVKFGYNTNITPHLISSEDMVAIYRILEREMDSSVDLADKDGEIKYIDYDHYK